MIGSKHIIKLIIICDLVEGGLFSLANRVVASERGGVRARRVVVRGRVRVGHNIRLLLRGQSRFAPDCKYNVLGTDRKRLNRLCAYFLSTGKARPERGGGNRQTDEQKESGESISRNFLILPLPKTNIGEAFYKRQLWLYNLGLICVDNTEVPYMYTWLESESGRGSNEIISALLHLLSTNYRTSEQTLQILI